MKLVERMTNRSLRAHILRFCLSLGLLALALPARATEPEGDVLFTTQGVVAPSEPPAGFQPGERLFQLSLKAVVPISDAVLVHSAPESVSQRLVTLRAAGAERLMSAAEGAALARVELGKLDPGVPVTLDFAEGYAEGKGGIVIFTIEGTGEGGRPVKAVYSFVVGTVGTPGVLRNGAIEFPAHELPESKP